MGFLSTGRLRARAALWLIVVAGTAARVWAAFHARSVHPDAYFQYIEPAFWHLTGNGIETWEWHVGLRSWILPFYNGAWMAGLHALGLPYGPEIMRLLKLHWALIQVALIFVAYRGGASVTRRLLRVPLEPRSDAAPAGSQGGLLAAALCAGFGQLVLYAGQTLSEPPSMLLLTAGLVLTAEITEPSACTEAAKATRTAALAGLLLSLGACMRIASAPLTLVPVAWLAVRGMWRPMFAMMFTSLGPVLVFCLVDLASWGTFAGSYIEYVTFNLIEGRAAQFGTSPADWYVEHFRELAPIGFPLLMLFPLLGLRGNLAFLLSAYGMLGYFSAQPHKEARFLLGLWTLLLIATGGVLGAWLARASSHSLHSGKTLVRNALHAFSIAVVAILLVEASRNPDADCWYDEHRLDALAWTSHQRGAVGVMVDDLILSSGVALWGKTGPLLGFHDELLGSPMISHVIARENTYQDFAARRAGYNQVFREEGGYVVLSNRAAATTAH
jgi:phosphatidylinositol glycan class B